ncbi:adherens junction formation factor afadin isoform X7 [Musca autumnalis]|uniref:adherens junction formation factor afadin isoform X7 n=1 Tax=Musca autumnalis TaxID=221902 RepID=UPI003CF13C8B
MNLTRSIMFHVRRRPADSQPRRRKKKPLGASNGANNISQDREGPMLVEVTHSGDGGRRIKLGNDPIEVGSANTNCLQLFGPSIQARHCLISLVEGVCTVTPLHADALTFVNGHHISQPTILHNGSVVMFGRVASYRFVDSPTDGRYNLALSQSQLDSACLYERSPKMPLSSTSAAAHIEPQGQEPILPAVLEFPETHQEFFLRHIITELDVNAPHFKLAPVYSLYLCARYRASTHYRPELQPTERAHKLTIFLHHVANLIYNVVQEQYTDPRILAFWMANSSEFLHFLKSDRHISAFSVQAQEVLAESVQTAFRNLVNCFRVELSQTLNQFLSETIDHDSAAGLVLTVLGSAMALLRRCRVNAALTIQLFSQLFHYINVICFNTIVANSHMCTAEWGKVMTERLQLLELWAERQGLELAADCHLAKINQCAQFLQAPKTSVEEIQQLACSCFRLNSLQMAALLQQEKIPRNLVDTAIRMAESVADELTRADGREVRLEESPELHLALLLPDDGFSCDVVRGIPSGLVDFLNPLQQQGMCRLAAQPTSIGLWTVYMHQFNARSSSAMSNKLPQPEVQVIKLHKNSNGMGLSIVAAKGAGQDRLGIYIKSVVPGGAADADGRLQAGDQLLRVDGQSLIGITQERAADYLVRTGPVVTLDVAKQGAIYHGLATLLQQPSPVIQRGNRRMSERDLTRMGADGKNVGGPHIANNHLANSKSVPALHHHMGSGTISMANSKSRSTHSLANPATNLNNTLSNNNTNNNNNNEQGFYQNLSVYRNQNQSQPILSERPPMPSHSAMNAYNGNSQQNTQNPILSPTNGTGPTGNQHQNHPYQQQQQQPHQNSQHPMITSPHSSNMLPNRPQSAYYQQQQPSSSQHQHMTQQQQQFAQHGHNFSASTTNLSTMQHPTQQQQQQQHSQHPMHHMTAQQQQLYREQQQQQSMTLGNRSKSTQNFQRDMQSQQSLRMQQMMAPSMPNISNMYQQQQQQQQSSHPGNHNMSMAASQSMQNVSSMGDALEQNNGGYLGQAQHSPAGGTQTLRRNMRPDYMDGGAQHSPNMPQMQQQQQQGNFMTLPPKPGQQQLTPPKQQQQPPTAPKPQQNRLSGTQQQFPPQSYLSQTMYSQQQQQQQQPQTAEEKPPLPPTTTHPLYKATQQITPGMNYIASTLDPPKGGYVPVSASALQQNKNLLGTNPWEREEREKEVEIRREHIRQWREQQINELSSIAQRTPQQDEQLKTLILERDFERRAQEMEEHEDESEPSYEKENVQEVFRLNHQQNVIQTPVTNFRQTEVKIASVVSDQRSNNSNETSPMSSARNSAAEPIQPPPIPANPPPSTIPTTIVTGTTTVQPKSILKNNRYDGSSTAPSSPSKSQKSASFADEKHLQTEHPISSLARDISHMSITNSSTSAATTTTTTTTSSYDNNMNMENSGGPPPPPPERNSSYLIMSQQKQRSSSIGLLKTATINSADMQKKSSAASILLNNNNNNIQNNLISSQQSSPSSSTMDMFSATSSSSPSSISAMMMRDNKRVSFHDEENNYVGGGGSTVYQHHQMDYNNSNSSVDSMSSTAVGNNGASSDLNSIREDSSFLPQNVDASMLPSMPATPDAAAWNNTVQSTPGVIGAQEVYRDPRTRRLAEKQQQQQQRNTEAVPEKLSFKEKMKMFALESGEDNTPKDKLKISRAQRDIDAVH